MPYSMTYYYNGIDDTEHTIEVNVYQFSTVGQLNATAICYTTGNPTGSEAPEELKKDMWLTVDVTNLKP